MRKTTTKRKKYGLKQKEIAKFFDYESENSFNNSTAKDRILKGVEFLIDYIESEIAERILK